MKTHKKQRNTTVRDKVVPRTKHLNHVIKAHTPLNNHYMSGLVAASVLLADIYLVWWYVCFAHL